MSGCQTIFDVQRIRIETSVAMIPTPNLADGPWRLLGYSLAGFACFGGLLSLALAAGAQARNSNT